MLGARAERLIWATAAGAVAAALFETLVAVVRSPQLETGLATLLGAFATTLGAATLPALLVAGLCVLIGRSVTKQLPPWAFIVPLWFGASITVAHGIHMLSLRLFVQQEVAAQLVPTLEIGSALMLALLLFLLWRHLLGEPLSRLLIFREGSFHLLTFLVASLLVVAVHLRRFPTLVDDPRMLVFPQLVMLALGALCAHEWRLLKGRARFSPVTPALALLLLASVANLPLSARIWPESHARRSHLLTAAHGMSMPLLSHVNPGADADGDGFLDSQGDCDDNNARINPYAKEIPGNEVDEDCFEGPMPANAAIVPEISGSLPTSFAPSKNLLLITADALRADALGFGGSGVDSSPTLDKLAERSLWFSRAYSHAPMTRKAFPALLAGRYPSNVHWLDLQNDYPYPVSHQDNHYLAERVAQQGFATACVLPFGYAKNSRFDQGFSSCKVHKASKFKNEINADRIAKDAISFIEGDHPQGFFLWVHFYEAHYPYIEHKQYGLGRSEWLRYLSEVRWIDDNVKTIVDALEANSLLPETTIIFSADHGEEFGEHGGRHHGDLYREDLHVPLFVVHPSLAPKRIDTPVGLIDIAPTALDVLGIPTEGISDLDGQSLLRVQDSRRQGIFSELLVDKKVKKRLLSWIEDDWHLIADFQSGISELYQLSADPKEQYDLAAQRPKVTRDLIARLRRFMATRVGPYRESKLNDKK